MLWSFCIISLSTQLPGIPHTSKFLSDCFLPLVSPSYQGEEQEVQLYYKEFSSTRHGFLGAGVVSQPLSQVWAAVSDPTLWPLYHKPIQTSRLHQRVTNSISLVYLVCDTTLCALKQLRDFCCVCVEAKEAGLTCISVPRDTYQSWQLSLCMMHPCQDLAEKWSEERSFPVLGSCSLFSWRGKK